MPGALTWVAISILAIGLVGIPHAGSTANRSPTIAPVDSSSQGDRLLTSGWNPLSGWNQTLSPAAAPGPAAVTAFSAIDPHPDPSLPPTAPTEVTFGPTISSTSACCIEHNFPAPSGGPWARIVLNFTGGISGGVFDTSYRAYIDQVLVLYGTTPEYGTWNVKQDLTEYASLFHGSVNLTYILSAVSSGGYYTSNVTLWFFPVPAGTAVPSPANDVIPLWPATPYIHSATPVAFATDTVPTNVSSASLELWTYAFGASEEFWYSGTPPYYRTMTVSVDGAVVLRMLPFPYVNTGGIDLFLWRPVTAAYTPSDRPLQFDATAMLGLLEGAHNFSVKVEGMPNSGATWLVAGTLLLHTNASVTGATSTLYAASPESSTVTTPSGGYDQAVNYSFRFGSDIRSISGVDHASLAVRAAYSSNVSNSGSGNWQNVSLHERMAVDSVENSTGRPEAVHSVYDFPFSMDVSSVFVPSSTSGGNTYGNATEKLENVDQLWQHTEYENFSGSGSGSSYVRESDGLVGASGTFTGAEEILSGGGAYLLAITNLKGTTPSEYQSTTSLDGTAGGYTHLLLAAGDNPPGPNNAETVVTNSVGGTIGASAMASPGTLDLGSSIAFHAIAAGGVSWPQYAWSNLPAGCPRADAPSLSCSPSTVGVWSPVVVISDSAGDLAIASAGSVVVNPAPTVSIRGPSSFSSDILTAVSFGANVTGGTAPFDCVWTVNLVVVTPPMPCTDQFSLTPGSLGPQSVSVNATDGSGLRVSSLPVTVQSVPQPTVTLSVPASGTTGMAITLHAVVTGGVAPFVYTWSAGSSLLGVTLSSWFNYTASSEGTFDLSVRVTDGSNLTALSLTVPLGVTAASATTSSGGPPLLWVGIAIVGWVAAGLGILLYLRSRSALRNGGDETPPGR